MISKIKSLWYLTKAFYKTFLHHIILTLLIGGTAGLIIFQHVKINSLKQSLDKVQHEVIDKYRDSLSEAEKSLNMLRRDIIMMDIAINKVYEQSSSAISQAENLKTQLDLMKSKNSLCQKKNKQLQVQVDLLMKQINDIQETAKAIKRSSERRR